MAVSVEQAAINSLITYLKTQLTDVDIKGTWPSAGNPLPARTITVLKIGARRETKLDPVFVSTAELSPPNSILKSYTWRVKAVEQTIELDVWSCYEAQRDDINAKLDAALNQGPAVTIPNLTQIDLDEFRDGLILALGDGHVGFVDFTFDGPEINDAPEDKQRSEFRATQTGTLYTYLNVTKTQPRFAHIAMTITADAAQDTVST